MTRFLRALRAVWGWLVDDRPEQVEGWHSTWLTDEYEAVRESQGGERR